MGDAPTLADTDEIDVEPDDGPSGAPDGSAVDPNEQNVDEQTVADAADDLDLDDPPSDVNEATVDLSDDDMGGGLFSGVEEGSSGSSSSDDPEAGQDGDGDESDDDALEGIADGLDGNAAAMEDAINDGAARLACVGLTDADFEDSDLTKTALEEEFQETFEAFRLGYFGSRAVEEYVLTPADGDVSPAWGLAGSALMAAAMIVWLRPDGDDAVRRAREAVGNLGGGL